MPPASAGAVLSAQRQGVSAGFVHRCNVDAKPILDKPGSTATSAEPDVHPLVVDLDGTLLRTDLLSESLLVLLKRNPLYILLLPFWLLKGKASFKHEVAQRASLDVRVLLYREELLNYLKRQRAQGRTLVLATASDRTIAQLVAGHLKLFDLVFASDGITNLAGEAKRDRLVSEFGARGFDYVANDRCDLVVWRSARNGIVVNPSRGLQGRLAQVTHVVRIFSRRRQTLADYLAPLRFGHWLKNLLIFVPLAAAHWITEIALWRKTILAFLAFGLCASGGYVLNDLFDLDSDRCHPEKRLRPFAAGNLPLVYGFALVPGLLVLGCVIGVFVSPLFLTTLLAYLTLTTTYSLYVRRVVLLDVIFLAGLYTMRILAGSAAIAIWPSQWLLAFSTFLFLSLALVKRYGELVTMRRVDGDQATARGYELGDGELLASMGVASGFLSVLVLALYVDSDAAKRLYGHYELMWLLCPLFLYWISHIWLVAHRGKMPGDPVVFATGDRVSRILIALMLIVALLAL